MKQNSIIVIDILCVVQLPSINIRRCSANSWFGVQTASRNCFLRF